MLLVRFFVNVYYVIVCAWAFFYLFVGFTSHLPWQDCGDQGQNTIGCYSNREVDKCLVGIVGSSITSTMRSTTTPTPLQDYHIESVEQYVGSGGKEQ